MPRVTLHEHVDDVLRDFALSVLNDAKYRIAGRFIMNQTTAELHPDPDVRARASVRAEAYRMSAGDVDHVLNLITTGEVQHVRGIEETTVEFVREAGSDDGGSGTREPSRGDSENA